MTSAKHKMIILAASAGSLFEYYDFYLTGFLATNIAATFFSGLNPTAGFIFTLFGVGAGFAARPFGAIVLGRIGDLVGRRYTFLVTILIMGLSTLMIGILPPYSAYGLVSPIAFVACRILQGLAIGGEYGGAATYVAEFASPARRGFQTAWMQITPSAGGVLSLGVILLLREVLDPAAFDAWGWRLPFLAAVLPLGLSIWARLRLPETPLFADLIREGTRSTGPILEAFGRWRNVRASLIVLFGASAGHATLASAAAFYLFYFLTRTLKVDAISGDLALIVASSAAALEILFFGWLSDKIGRKPIIVAGCLLGAVFLFPLYWGLTWAVNPALSGALAHAPVSVVADPAECSFQFNLLGASKVTTSCDIAKSYLANNGISYGNVAAPSGTIATIRIGDQSIPAFDRAAAGVEAARMQAGFEASVSHATLAAGYPADVDQGKVNLVAMLGLIILIVTPGGMVFAPLAAMLVESFPTRIRYCAVSLPYHIANGWFGGFLPATAFALVAATGNIYSGLWYPVGFAVVASIVGLIWLPETYRRDISAVEMTAKA